MTKEIKDYRSFRIYKTETGYCVMPKFLLMQASCYKNQSAVSKFSSQEITHLNKRLASIDNQLRKLRTLLCDGFKIGGKKIIPYPNKSGELFIEKAYQEWQITSQVILMFNGVEKRKASKFPIDLMSCCKEIAIYLFISFDDLPSAEAIAIQVEIPANAVSTFRYYLSNHKAKLKKRPPDSAQKDLAILMYNLGSKSDSELFSWRHGDRSTLSYKKYSSQAKRAANSVASHVKDILKKK